MSVSDREAPLTATGGRVWAVMTDEAIKPWSFFFFFPLLIIKFKDLIPSVLHQKGASQQTP